MCIESDGVDDAFTAEHLQIHFQLRPELRRRNETLDGGGD
jgi:hypothetical protein